MKFLQSSLTNCEEICGILSKSFTAIRQEDMDATGAQPLTEGDNHAATDSIPHV